MPFQLNITITKEDYLAFNYFHSLESKASKKRLRKVRITYLLIAAALFALVYFRFGWSTVSIVYAIALGLYTLLYLLLMKQITKWSIKASIKRTNKAGKLAFDEAAALVFYGDHLVENTATKRVEQNYEALDRICVLKDRYIFLYDSSLSAYILPIPQIREQLSEDEFLGFLFSKCSTVEYY